MRKHRGEILSGAFIRFGLNQAPGDLGDFLFDNRPQILDQRGLQRWIAAGLQRAGNRAGQAAQYHDMRGQAPDGDDPRIRRIPAEGVHQFHQKLE